MFIFRTWMLWISNGRVVTPTAGSSPATRAWNRPIFWPASTVKTPSPAHTYTFISFEIFIFECICFILNFFPFHSLLNKKDNYRQEKDWGLFALIKDLKKIYIHLSFYNKELYWIINYFDDLKEKEKNNYILTNNDAADLWYMRNNLVYSSWLFIFCY